MKKLVFMLLAALSVALTGCSAFDSEPIEPKIIGTGNLQYEAKSGTWFVVVDSTQYTVTKVTIPEHDPHSFGKIQNVDPVEGMLVTVFTSPRKTGVQAVAGKQSVEQIEELYRTNETGVIIFAFLFVACLIGIAYPAKKQKIDVVNADV